MDKLKDEKVDIFLGNHVWNNNTPEKYEKLMVGDKYAFVAPSDWAECMIASKKRLEELMKQEKE